MRDDCQRNIVNARMPSRFATGKTGQLSAVAFREVPSGGTNLLFNQEIIVKQPFSGRRDAFIRLYGLAQQFTHSAQLRFIRSQSRQQPVATSRGRYGVQSRECSAMRLHLVGAKQFGTDRGLNRSVVLDRPLAIQPCGEFEQGRLQALKHRAQSGGFLVVRRNHCDCLRHAFACR